MILALILIQGSQLDWPVEVKVPLIEYQACLLEADIIHPEKLPPQALAQRLRTELIASCARQKTEGIRRTHKLMGKLPAYRGSRGSAGEIEAAFADAEVGVVKTILSSDPTKAAEPFIDCYDKQSPDQC